MNCYNIIWCMFLVVFLLSVHVFVCMCVYMTAPGQDTSIYS